MLSQNAEAVLELNSSIMDVYEYQDLANRLFEVLKSYIHIDWLGFFVMNRFDTHVTVTTNDHITFNWDEHYMNIFNHDAFGRQTLQGQPGDVFFSHEIFNAQSDEDVYVMDYIRKHANTNYCMTMPILMEEGNRMVMGLYRGDRSCPFGQNEKEIMLNLFPLLVTKTRMLMMCREYELKLASLERLIDNQEVNCIFLDDRLVPIDVPMRTLEMLSNFYGQPSISKLPLPLMNWLRNVVAPGKVIDSNGGPWSLEQHLPGGRLRCTAYSVIDERKRPSLMVVFKEHTGREDFSALTRYGLTKREIEVISYLPLGYSNNLIAQALEITEVTVKKHLRNAGLKLGASGKTEIIYHAVKKLREID